MFSNSMNIGKVYLVGAGPGDPDLITIRGLKILQKADVVVYDRLANPDLLMETPAHTKHIFVGKTAGKPSIKQDQINKILVDMTLTNETVVRLKGGDPLIFGRGGEELLVLASHNIPYEVIPGISSAVAAPAYAGIPLTHREFSSSFTVITGHTVSDNNFPVDWKSLSKCETLIILMGFRKLPVITKKLIHAGKPISTPVAIIEKATYKNQKVIYGSLLSIDHKARKLATPATIIIGEIAKLGHRLAWFQNEDSTEIKNRNQRRSLKRHTPVLAHL